MSILTATGDVAVSSGTIQAAPVSAVYLLKVKNNTFLNEKSISGTIFGWFAFVTGNKK